MQDEKMIKLLRKGCDVPTEYFNWSGVNGGRLLLGRTLLAIHGKKTVRVFPIFPSLTKGACLKSDGVICFLPPKKKGVIIYSSIFQLIKGLLTNAGN